jgi:hypothetical protein
MQTDSELQSRLFGLISIRLRYSLLKLNCRAQGLHGARKLRQRTVPGQLDQPPAMPDQCRLKPLLAVFPEARQRTGLVPAHQTGVANHICCHDGGQPSLFSRHSIPIPVWRKSYRHLVSGATDPKHKPRSRSVMPESRTVPSGLATALLSWSTYKAPRGGQNPCYNLWSRWSN